MEGMYKIRKETSKVWSLDYFLAIPRITSSYVSFQIFSIIKQCYNSKWPPVVVGKADKHMQSYKPFIPRFLFSIVTYIKMNETSKIRKPVFMTAVHCMHCFGTTFCNKHSCFRCFSLLILHAWNWNCVCEQYLVTAMSLFSSIILFFSLFCTLPLSPSYLLLLPPIHKRCVLSRQYLCTDIKKKKSLHCQFKMLLGKGKSKLFRLFKSYLIQRQFLNVTFLVSFSFPKEYFSFH